MTSPAGKPARVKDLRNVAQSLSKDAFLKNVGAFVLVQAPTPKEQKELVKALGQRSMTVMSDGTRQDGFKLTADLDELIVHSLPPLKGRDVLNVGRTEDNGLILDDPTASKFHATVRWDESIGRFMVHDQGSRNGTFVNGARVKATRLGLDDGDLVSFGSVHFLFFKTATLYARLRNEDDGSFVIERS